MLPSLYWLKNLPPVSMAEAFQGLGLEQEEGRSGKAAKVTITQEQQTILRQITSSTTASRRLIQRAQVILLAFGGALNVLIAPEVPLLRKQHPRR